MTVLSDVELQAFRVKQAEFARQFHLTLEEYLKITRSCTAEEVATVLELCRTKTHRSYRRSHAHQQIQRWLDGQSVFSKPLNGSQFKEFKPSWPVGWQLPVPDSIRLRYGD